MLIESLDVDQGKVDLGRWPFTIPAVRQLAEDGLEFVRPITVLVGANGSGKSTVLEAIAEKYGLDASGGHGGRARANVWGKSALGDGAQVIYSTHSPMVAALPGAQGAGTRGARDPGGGVGGPGDGRPVEAVPVRAALVLHRVASPAATFGRARAVVSVASFARASIAPSNTFA